MGHVCQQVSLDLITHLGRNRNRPQSGEGPDRPAPACPSSKTSPPPLGQGQVPQPSTNLPHAGVVNEASVGTGTSNDEPGSEESSSDCQLVIVNEASLGLDRQTKS